MASIHPNITIQVKKAWTCHPYSEQKSDRNKEMKKMMHLEDKDFERSYKYIQEFKWKYVDDIKRKSTEHLELNNTLSDMKNIFGSI